MSMTARNTIKTLEKLVDALREANGTEETQLCITIDIILTKLDEWAETNPDAKEQHPNLGSASMYIAEMRTPLHSIAGLYEYGHDRDQCLVWLRAGISKLSSSICFNI